MELREVSHMDPTLIGDDGNLDVSNQMKSAIASTPQMDVGLLPKIVDTTMPVKNVDSEDMEKRRALSKKLAEMGAQP
jgi:hypothetical protein